jgi:glycosyltransferase involved in cell wall biosynthesis
MRLLVLTHTFPPSPHSNAKRPFYLVKGFLQAGWQVDVITSTIGLATPVTEPLAHPALRVLRHDDPLERFYGKFAGRPALARLAGLLASGVCWPDGHLYWCLRAMRTCGDAAGYDRVLVFILPASLLLLGRRPGRVRRHWLFDYQESVTPHWRQHPRRSPLNRLGFPRLVRLERRTLAQAGRVVFTAATNRQAYLEAGLLGDTPTAHVPYFYDAEVFSQETEPPRERFRLGYFGSFDWRGARSPEVFLRSLACFLEAHPAARPHTEFLFHGLWLPEHTRLLEELKLRDVVSLQPAVPYETYLRRLAECSVLLLVVAPEHNLFMPSKIVDYFGARRPILAFVPRASEMRRVLETAGMAAFTSDEDDVAAGAAALERLWQAQQAGTLRCDSARTGFWSSTEQVPRYLELVRQTGPPA